MPFIFFELPFYVGILNYYSFGFYMTYQLDFVTPGSLPAEARDLKQIRHIPNFLKKPRGLPQIGQRLYALTLYFGFLFALFLKAAFAKPILLLSLISKRHT